MNLAVDAGGTNLRAQLWDHEHLVDSFFAQSSEIGLFEWIKTILNQNSGVKYVGIAYAGQVRDGKILSSPNIHIDQYEIKKALESSFDLSVNIQNDLACAVIAEADVYKSKNIAALYVGTGLGLGVIESGRLVRGAYNMATEIGHIPYKKAPFSCGCGRNNCIELFASGSGLKKWTQHYKLECDHSLKSLKKCTNKDIVKSFEEALVHASGVITTLFNPEVLVLGGGIITANPYLKDIILQTISDHALPQALDGLKICTSTIEDAPIKGALLLKDYDD